ncbi:O-antigen ligase family protein [Aestuariimicrobium ganziense]|uniref:O-antigen ligase family protein n=1 Tax=Aestuariimicrobium ganziense TaxID=2773677 RepID=UPI001941F5EA|nr:O-antigen ligase family protein [Aestuariimicrobium ganziense]
MPVARGATGWRLTRVEVAGLVTVALWWAWVLTSSVIHDRSVLWGSPYLVAPAAVLLGVVLGRLAGRVDRIGPAPDPDLRTQPLYWLLARGRWVDALAVAAAVLVLPGTPVHLAPVPAPLGYANANTAAATQVMAFCGLLLLGTTGRVRRAVLAAAAVLAGVAGVWHGSWAGITVLAPVALAVLVAVLARPRRTWWMTLPAVAALGSAVAGLLWLTTRRTWPEVATSSLSDVRRVLWQRALELWSTSPVGGGGPGAYVEVNPYASDPDLAAAHSSLLQVLSELGLVGASLLGLLVVWGLAMAAAKPAPWALVTLAAWTALWVHSLMDHLFDHPALGLLAGVLLGFGSRASIRTVPRPPG